MADGLHDLIHFPAVGLRTSPTAFALGVVQGMSSLMKKTVSSLCITASDFSESLQVGLIALGVVDPSLSSLELFTSSSFQYPTIKNIQNENENENENRNENENENSNALNVSQNNRNTPISVSVKTSEENNTVFSSSGSSSSRVGAQNTIALGYEHSASTSTSASNSNNNSNSTSATSATSSSRNYRPKGGIEGVKQGK